MIQYGHKRTGNFQETKKEPKKAYFQNILEITCKNESGKSLFMQVVRSHRRNEESPLRALTQFMGNITKPKFIVEMKKAR